MIPRQIVVHGGLAGIPRTRGDDPDEGISDGVPPVHSPHTRG